MPYHYRAEYQERILIGELSTASPTVVVEWLRLNWKEPRIGVFGDPTIDDYGRRLLENVLVRRGDRAINFALARYGYCKRAIQKAAELGSSAALYAAANNPRGGVALSQRDFILKRGRYPLLRALLQNKCLPARFIESLLMRKDAFKDLSDERLFWIVMAIAGNERLNRPHDSDYLDGYEEHLYHKPFDAAWGLAKTVPVNQEWASALHSMLEKTQPAVSFDGVQQALERWRIEPPLPKPVPWFKRKPSFLLRSLIADRLQADEALHRAKDPALQMSFYRRFQPAAFPNWPDFLNDDGEEFFQNVLENVAIWHRPDERARLDGVAWDIGKADSNLDAVNSFRAVKKRFQSLYPDWFKEEDSE